jgi:hypothetical protein
VRFLPARSTTDVAMRTRIYHQMMAMLAEQAPAIFMFGLPSLYGVGKNAEGFSASADKILRLAKARLKQGDLRIECCCVNRYIRNMTVVLRPPDLSRVSARPVHSSRGAREGSRGMALGSSRAAFDANPREP